MSPSNKQQWALFLTWLIALSALLISLYSSDVLGMPVCHLCWYQRVCIYPLVIIVGIASFRNDAGVVIYALPLSLLGAIFAIYQYLGQMMPGFSPINVCSAGPSCSTIHMKLLEFITYPFISFMACVVMSLLLIIAKKAGSKK